jgi:hypothetical protein
MTIGAGVSAGAAMPYQAFMIIPLTPSSSRVGTSGIEGWRLSAATAGARILPPLMCENAPDGLPAGW